MASLCWLGAVWLGLSAAAQEPPSASAEVDLVAAEEALRRGDPPAAERAFRRLLIDRPSSPRAMVGWAESLAAQGRGREALASLRRLAEQEVVSGRLGVAVDLLEVAVKIAPREGSLRSRYGQLLARDRRYRSAEKALAEAHAAGARDPSTLLYWASSLWENGRVEEAEVRYREAVRKSGRSAAALHQLGRLLLWQSRFAEAVTILEEAGARGAAGLDFDLDLARALSGSVEVAKQENGKLAERAVAAYRAVVRQAPEHSQARYGLMMALRRAGRKEEAARESLALARLYEEDRVRAREATLTGAKVATARRRLDVGDARGALELLIALDGDLEALRLRALCWRALGDSRRAAEALRSAITLAPERQDLQALLREIDG